MATVKPSSHRAFHRITRWVVGIVFAINALAVFGGHPFKAIILLACAALLIPPVALKIEKGGLVMSRWSRVFVYVVGFVLMVNSAGQSASNKMKTVRQNETQQAASIAPSQSSQQAAAERTESVAETIEPENDAQEGQSDYQIVYELSGIRYDGGKNLYALVESVDLTTDAFKADIKRAVDEIVKTKGHKISIDFVNDRGALDLIYKSQYGNSTLGRTLTKAESDMIETSLVAQFSGLLETDLYPNTLSFFPGAFTDNPTVGKYVETIEYNPAEM